MSEILKRGHEAVGLDIADAYAGVVDGSDVTTMPYVGLDIIDKDTVKKPKKKLNRMELFIVEHGRCGYRRR